jgi:ADP-ribosylglycohydrolase
MATLPPASEPSLRERFQGCLLAGAIGDALGAPVDFMSWREIESRFGPNEIRT